MSRPCCASSPAPRSLPSTRRRPTSSPGSPPATPNRRCLWQPAGRFDPDRGTVRALLFTIARRVAADLRRRPSSRQFAPEAEEAGALDARADEVLLSVTVRDAMMSLSPAHREVLVLAYDEDLRLTDIAARLDLPLGTVKTRAFYALRALRDALRERGCDG